MEEQLIALLLADGGVQLTFGNRVWPLVAPQNSARPYIVLQKISGPTDYTTQGESGYSQDRAQLDVYADDYRQAKRGARQARAAISGRRVGIVKGIFALTERDLTESNTVLTSPNRVYRVSQDFMVHHTGD